jgi:GT2 family glycosyltransferase
MNITFGICTEYEDLNRVQEMVSSIDALHIPHYEIIIAGPLAKNDTFFHISSLGHLRQFNCGGWITYKKNIIAKMAHYDTLVLCHDYFVFDSNWYNSYLNFPKTWDVCSNPQYLINGKRHFTDWVTWDHPVYGKYYSLPYNSWEHTKNQYLSGGFIVADREFMRNNPFNESMLPGQPEDVEWSLRVRDKAKIVCNPDAIVRHNKKHRDVK